jgi:hypothetical protein
MENQLKDFASKLTFEGMVIQQKNIGTNPSATNRTNPIQIKFNEDHSYCKK